MPPPHPPITTTTIDAMMDLRWKTPTIQTLLLTFTLVRSKVRKVPESICNPSH